jgi:hypothetical protein
MSYEGARQLGQAVSGALSLPAQRRAKWRALNPIEQNLQRASHSVAYIVLPVAAAAKLGGVDALLSGVDPGARLLLIAAYAVLSAVSLARLAYGWRRCAARDGLLTLRAVFKVALGLFLLCWHLPPDAIAPSLYPWLALAQWVAALWLAITGAVRFAALVRPAGRALPIVEDDIAANQFDWDE